MKQFFLAFFLVFSLFGAEMPYLTMGIPFPWAGGAIDPAFASFSLDNSTNKVAWIFAADTSNAITHFSFRYNNGVGNPPIYRISLQGVNASTGAPDGFIKGGGTPASATFDPPADDTWNGTERKIALANPYVPVKGERLAAVIEYDSGTIDGSNYASITHSLTNMSGRIGFPYALQNTGTWSKQTTLAIFGVHTISEVYGRPMVSFQSGTASPDEQAMAFSLPAAACATFKLSGVLGFLTAVAGKTITISLYEGTTVLQDVTFDSNVTSNPVNAAIEAMFDETELPTLTCGTTYRIGFKPNEGNSWFRINYFDVADASDLAAWPGGTSWHLSLRPTSGGTWTDAIASRPIAGIIITDITVPASGGSGGTRSYATVQ